MGHTGWRHVETGRIVREAPDACPGPKWRPIVENVDVHTDEARPYTLKVISLWQPYASLLFVNKRHETRHWVWPDKLLGVEVGVHAAQKLDRVAGPLHEICVETFGADYAQTLPRGAILGTVIMDRSTPTASTPPESAADVYAGDWTAGRFATRVDRRSRWRMPIPAKGQQGFWNVTDDQLNASARAAIDDL